MNNCNNIYIISYTLNNISQFFLIILCLYPNFLVMEDEESQSINAHFFMYLNNHRILYRQISKTDKVELENILYKSIPVSSIINA